MYRILFAFVCLGILVSGFSAQAQVVLETHEFGDLSVDIPSSWVETSSDDPYDNEVAFFEHFIGVSLRVLSLSRSEAESEYGDYSPEVVLAALKTIESEEVNGITRAFGAQKDGLYVHYLGDTQLLSLVFQANSPEQLADINMYYDLPIITDSVRPTGTDPEDYYGYALDNAISIYRNIIREKLQQRDDTGVRESSTGIRVTDLASIMPPGGTIGYPGLGVDRDFTRVYTIAGILTRYDVAGWYETAAVVREAVDEGSLLGVSVKSWGSMSCSPAGFDVSVWLFDEESDAEIFVSSGKLEKAWDQDGFTGDELDMRCTKLLKHAITDQKGQFAVTARVIYNDETSMEQFESDLRMLVDTIWENISTEFGATQ